MFGFDGGLRMSSVFGDVGPAIPYLLIAHIVVTLSRMHGEG